MQVSIKSFDIKMDVKSKGMEFEVRGPDGTLLGYCYLTMSGLVWCKGKTLKKNGKRLPWNKFIKMMEE